jgi:hypothetical protein
MAFTAIPAIPQSGLNEFEYRILKAVKQNLDELTGQSRELRYRSVLTGNVTVVKVGTLQSKQLSISGRAYNLTNIGTVPAQEDFIQLAKDVKNLIADVQRIRDILDTLITQLKG